MDFTLEELRLLRSALVGERERYYAVNHDEASPYYNELDALDMRIRDVIRTRTTIWLNVNLDDGSDHTIRVGEAEASLLRNAIEPHIKTTKWTSVTLTFAR